MWFLFIIILVVLVPLAIWLTLQRSTKSQGDEVPEALIDVCALCHAELPMEKLIEKEVGEYGRAYCFCDACIEKLYHESQAKREG
jgi:Flp pilus assembly protein TadB